MGGQSKYAPLANHLAAVAATVIRVSFAEVDQLLTGGLPESAYRYRTWWTSNTDASALGRHGWASAGYRVSQVDLAGGLVTFTQIGPGQGGWLPTRRRS